MRPSDISPTIAFLLGLNSNSVRAPAKPAHLPSRRTPSKSIAIAAAAFNQDDRATLALLTLPVLLMVFSLAITQSLKPIRRVEIATTPAAILTTAVVAPRPVLAPAKTTQIPLTPAAINPTSSPRPSELNAPNPLFLPANPGIDLPAASSPPLTAVPPVFTPDTDQTALLITRPPAALDARPSAVPLPPIASQDAELDTEPKLCTARPASQPPDLTLATSTPEAFGLALASAARAQTHDLVIYNDKYRALSYPRGDVQPLFGVCTDVIIRAYRALGVDLQQLVHESRIGNGDTSIDHRRTETLRRFFARAGRQLPASTVAEDYLPGDVVTYDRPQNRGSRSHIALVSSVVAPSGRYMIIHNRGWGPQLEDGLFVDAITGHYRYTPQAAAPLLANIPVISAPQKRPPALTRMASRSHRRLDGASVNGLGR